MRRRFDEQLDILNKDLIEMGALCESVIALAAKALSDGEKSLLDKIPTIDSEIDRMESSIESLCLKLLLQQQPVARDLRQISAALKMITDMERIGDQASDIAEIIGFMGSGTDRECSYISEMAKATINMVNKSIDAYISHSTELAEDVIQYDDVVDDYFNKIKSRIISLIAENPSDGEYAVDMLMIAKYFERIGDHATNIAEWVVFSVTGVHKGESEL